MRPLIATRDLHPAQGGPPRIILSHALELARRGHSPLVVATVRPGMERAVQTAWPELEQAGIELQLFPRSGPDRAGYSSQLGSFLVKRMQEVDIVHLHGVWEHCLAQVANEAWRQERPVVLQPHGLLDRWSRARSRVRKAVAARLFGTYSMLRRVDAVLFHTEEERDEAAELRIGGRVYFIANGVDMRRIPVPSGRAEETLFDDFPALRQRMPRLLFYSRMHPKKGVDLLLEAVSRVLPTHPDLGLLIAALPGDPHYEAKVRARAEKADLRENVAISMDHDAERGQSAMRGTDIFCLTSYQEGFSMAALEAMAHRLPVLLTDSCHMGFVAKLRAGEVVPVNVDAIAAGLERLLSVGEAALRDMGSRGHAWVVGNATVEKVGESLEAMYRDLILEKQSAVPNNSRAVAADAGLPPQR